MDSTNTSFHQKDEQTNTNLAYSLGFSFVVLVVLVIVCYISYKCSRSWSSSSRRITTTTATIAGGGGTASIFIDDVEVSDGGLDPQVLESYPKFLYSQAKLVIRSKDDPLNSGCSICLSDYKDSDMLRLLPECGHLFHLRCIDPWLKLHPSCPLCRSSPMISPLAEVVPLSMHHHHHQHN